MYDNEHEQNWMMFANALGQAPSIEEPPAIIAPPTEREKVTSVCFTLYTVGPHQDKDTIMRETAFIMRCKNVPDWEINQAIQKLGEVLGE